MQDTHRNRMNGFWKFTEDSHIREIAINLLLSDPSERTFSVGGELIVVNGIPTGRDIHMKIGHMWSTYDKEAKFAYSNISH